MREGLRRKKQVEGKTKKPNKENKKRGRSQKIFNDQPKDQMRTAT